MAETKSSGSWNLDGIAAKLEAKAEEFLQSTSSTVSKEATDDGSAATGGKREALRNVANIVKEQAGKGLESSKDYLSQVVANVSAYATDASTTASTQLAGAKETGLSKFTSASESANLHYAAVKEKASTHLSGLQTNLNKAIAQGQGQATTTRSGSETTDGTRDRELPAEDEPLTFPYNVIAWLVSICHGKGTSTTATVSESASSTSKDFSIESLQNAATTLTETLSEGVTSIKSSGPAKVETTA